MSKDRTKPILFLLLLCGCEGKREAPKPLPVSLPSVAGIPTPPPGLYVEIFHRRPVPKGTLTNIDQAETQRAKRPTDLGSIRTLGLAYYAGGGYEAAIRVLKEAVQKAPEDSVSLLYLGYSHMALGDYPQALEALSKVDSAEAELQQGNIFFQALQKDAEAEKHYRTAIQKAPRDGEPVLALGLLLASQGKRALAQERLQTAAQMLPPGPLRDTARDALARLKR